MHYVDFIVTEYNKHLRSNQLPELTREEIVQRICRDTPANICRGEGYEFKERDLGWQDVVNGTKVLATFIAAGRPVVSQELAQKRAEICANCQENVGYRQNCSTCERVEDAVRSVVGDRTTTMDARLRACFLCGCSNKAQVHLPIDILAKGVNPDLLKMFSTVKECWKYKELTTV